MTMSYDIVRSLSVSDKGIRIVYASNNVYPKHWTTYTIKPNGKTKEEMEVEIMKEYESGNWQGGTNRYAKAFEVLRHMPEYAEFNWRTLSCEDRSKVTKKPEFEALLLKALHTPYPKERYVLTRMYGQNKMFGKLLKYSVRWVMTPNKATKFAFEQDAMYLKDNITNGSSINIEKL